MVIHYVVGDATDPNAHLLEGDPGNYKPAIIAHIVNDRGLWGAGFVRALSKQWREPEACYHQWAMRETFTPPFELGNIQLVEVPAYADQPPWYVCNMIAQRGVMGPNNQVPLEYNALKTCLQKLNIVAMALNATIHMPKIGAGLGGGDWDLIKFLISLSLTQPTTIYTLQEEE